MTPLPDQSAVVKHLLAMEVELGLFDWRVGTTHPWERLRFPLGRYVTQKVTAGQGAHDRPSRSRRGAHLLRGLTPSPFRSSAYTATSVLAFGHPRRKLESDGFWWDIYFDTWLDTLPCKHTVVETPYQGTQHFVPARSSNIRYVDPPSLAPARTLLRQLVGNQIFRASLLTKSELDDTIELEHQLGEAFGVYIPLKNQTERILSRREIELPVYDYLLREFSPRVVLLVVSYSEGKKNLIEACQNLGIPTVELQHGTVSKSHLGYHYPEPRSTLHCPDYVLTFGPKWNDLCDWPISQERVVSVGFPYFEQAKERYVSATPSQPGHVLFISQGPIGKRLSRFAVRCAEAHPTLKITYKLHPGERARWRSEYPWLFSSALDVVEGDSPPLYRLMAEANLVIGAGSTALYEAAGLGTQVALIPSLAGRQRSEDFRELLGEDGIFVETSDEVKAAAFREGRCEANEGGRLFRRSATENIISFLEPFTEEEP